ncbi:Prophage P4 integrase [Dickeya dadantii 3937]|uniref:Prophage P4 integrase n=1 Tax=Dickeya dadantii (strain 3937) TaxID=198628 RepID=E0SAG6_DICD3|nr:Prophage P4 integrase [Dickeya dadantii 3937]
MILHWWADFLDANREKGGSLFDFAKFTTSISL